MGKKSIVGIFLAGVLMLGVGVTAFAANVANVPQKPSDNCEVGLDLKPVIYLYPTHLMKNISREFVKFFQWLQLEMIILCYWKFFI